MTYNYQLDQTSTDMRIVRTIAAVCFASAFLLAAPSCATLVKKDNGKHKGWYKNTNNPHNPASAKTTGSGSKSTTTVKTNGNKTQVKVKGK